MKIPLSSKHFLPGTVIRHVDWPPGAYAMVLAVGEFGITYITTSIQVIHYTDLMEGFEMWVCRGSRWEPCYTET